MKPSIAHKFGMNHIGTSHFPDGLVPWRDALAPDIESGITTGRLRGCEYCGSMHPTDVAAAITAGAKGSWADFKYGWPHKSYFDGIPNPHAGMLESRCGRSNPPLEEVAAGKWIKIPCGFNQRTGERQFTWTEAGKPAAATTYGKFYTEHLLDASPEERDIIEKHLRAHFEFTEDGKVSWKAA